MQTLERSEGSAPAAFARENVCIDNYTKLVSILFKYTLLDVLFLVFVPICEVIKGDTEIICNVGHGVE